MATATRQNPAKDASNSSVRVEIFDQAYNLRGSDPEYILKLAEYVDAKMRTIAEQTQTVDSLRLAVPELEFILSDATPVCLIVGDDFLRVADRLVAFAPTMRLLRGSIIGSTTLLRSYSEAPAATACRASSSSKSARGRTTP